MRAGESELKDPIRIKPHHFVDIITALGAGQTEFQPHPYGHGVHTVAAKMLTDRDAVVEMELGADDVCRPCKHNRNGICADTIDTSYRPAAPRLKRQWNLLIDGRWCERLGIAQGERMTAGELCRRLQDRAGEITDIYAEIPADRTGERAANLKKGIQYFLEKG